MKKRLPKPGSKAHHELLLHALAVLHIQGFILFRGYNLMKIKYPLKIQRAVLAGGG